MYRPLVAFVAATGLRPEEWQAVGRADVDRGARLLNVGRTVSSGEIVELGMTAGSRRQVPLSRRALEALDRLPPRLDTRLLFPAKAGGLMNLDNWRRREWAPAIEASGVATPARIYDMRSTFASNALVAGVSVFELARVMGTSVRMIERHYGTLLDGAGARLVTRLNAFDAELDPPGREHGGAHLDQRRLWDLPASPIRERPVGCAALNACDSADLAALPTPLRHRQDGARHSPNDARGTSIRLRAGRRNGRPCGR